MIKKYLPQLYFENKKPVTPNCHNYFDFHSQIIFKSFEKDYIFKFQKKNFKL